MNRRKLIISTIGAVLFPPISQSISKFKPEINNRETYFTVIAERNPSDTGEEFATNLISELVRCRREFPKHDFIRTYAKNEDLPFVKTEIQNHFGTHPSWLRLIPRAVS